MPIVQMPTTSVRVSVRRRFMRPVRAPTIDVTVSDTSTATKDRPGLGRHWRREGDQEWDGRAEGVRNGRPDPSPHDVGAGLYLEDAVLALELGKGQL